MDWTHFYDGKVGSLFGYWLYGIPRFSLLWLGRGSRVASSCISRSLQQLQPQHMDQVRVWGKSELELSRGFLGQRQKTTWPPSRRFPHRRFAAIEVLVRDWLGEGAEDQELLRVQKILEALTFISELTACGEIFFGAPAVAGKKKEKHFQMSQWPIQPHTYLGVSRNRAHKMGGGPFWFPIKTNHKHLEQSHPFDLSPQSCWFWVSAASTFLRLLESSKAQVALCFDLWGMSQCVK